APDFILVSLWFGTVWRVPLGNLGRCLTVCAALLECTLVLANGLLVVSLDGGFAMEALAQGSETVCRLLEGEPPAADPLGPPPDPKAWTPRSNWRRNSALAPRSYATATTTAPLATGPACHSSTP